MILCSGAGPKGQDREEMTKVSGTQIAWTVAGGSAAVLTALLLGGGYLWWQQGKNADGAPPTSAQQGAGDQEIVAAVPQQDASSPAPQHISQDMPQNAPRTVDPIVSELQDLPENNTADAAVPPEVPAEPAEATQEERIGEPEVAAAEADTAGGASTDEPVVPVLSAPVLDVVRVESDGFALVAGSAQSGAAVSVLLDGAELDRQEVGAGGEFVSFLPIPQSSQPQVLSLRAEFEGQVAYSEASFILAPVEVEVAVAPQDRLPAQEPTADEQSPEERVEPEAAPGADGAEPLAPAASPQVSETIEPLPTVNEVAASGPPDEVALSEEGAADVVETAASEAMQIAENTADLAPLADVESAPKPEPQQDVAEVPDDAASEQDLTVDTAAVAEADAMRDPLIDVVADAPVEGGQDAEAVADPEPAPNPVTSVAVLKADSSGIQLVQPAVPTPPGQAREVVLDTISYSPEGDVLLAGRARPDGLVRVYLDNAPVAKTASASDGTWKTELTDVAPGIYTLRLDELAGDGARVLSRIETPFKREAPEVLAPATVVGADEGVAAPRIQAITVQAGDTLWAISNAAYGEGLLYVRVFEANKEQIRNPDLIYPGQIFNLPE